MRLLLDCAFCKGTAYTMAACGKIQLYFCVDQSRKNEGRKDAKNG